MANKQISIAAIHNFRDTFCYSFQSSGGSAIIITRRISSQLKVLVRRHRFLVDVTGNPKKGLPTIYFPFTWTNDDENPKKCCLMEINLATRRIPFCSFYSPLPAQYTAMPLRHNHHKCQPSPILANESKPGIKLPTQFQQLFRWCC